MFSSFTYIVSNFEKVLFFLLFLGSHYGTCHTSPYAMPIHTTHSNINPPHHPFQQTKSPLHPPPPSSLTFLITFLPRSCRPLPCHHREKCLIIPLHQVSPLFFIIATTTTKILAATTTTMILAVATVTTMRATPPPPPIPPNYLAHIVV
jgi:hypothetical protein